MFSKADLAARKYVRRVSDIANNVSISMLAVLMLIGTCDVIGRYLFNKPIRGVVELGEVLLAGIVFFGWAYTQAAGGHIKVEMFTSRLAPRVRAKINFATSFLSLALFSLIGWQAAKLAMMYWEQNRLVGGLMIPIAPFVLFISLGALLICLELIIQMLNFLSEMRGEQ